MSIDPKTRVMPGPGIYRDIPAPHYHGWPAASASRLRIIGTQSPAHLKVDLDTEAPATAGQDEGTMLHTLVLQPKLFPELYGLRPAGNANSNDYKRDVAKLQAERPFVTLVKSETLDQVKEVRDAVLAHELGKVAFGGGDHEVTIVFDDPATGVRCKARLDAPLADVGIFDLKKVRDARPSTWGRDAWNYRYDIQAIFYLRACEAARLPVPSDFAFFCVEWEKPYGIRIYDFQDPRSKKILLNAETEVEGLLRQYKQCQDSGKWPNYPVGTEPFPLPDYAMREVEHAAEAAAEGR